MGESALKRKPRLAKNVNRDVVLCRTYNRTAVRTACELLMEDSISDSQRWIRIPFFFQKECHGATEVCVVSVNRNDYTSARRSISRLDMRYRRRLAVNSL